MRNRTAIATAKAIRFFRKHGGYSKGPGESTSQAKTRSATAMARAEAEANSRGWRVEWEGDPESYDPGDETDYEPKEVLGAVLRDGDGKVLASLWGIADPTRQYRRVVEAELAAEALAGQ